MTTTPQPTPANEREQTPPYSIEEMNQIGATLAERLGLKHDREHRDRWQTGWGSKTNYGLALTVIEMARRIQEGEANTI